MADAVTRAKLISVAEVDWTLGHAAVHARFTEADLASILHHSAGAGQGPSRRARETAA
jgi:hypothetical protein